MREEFTRNGANDFNRRYQGTFGYFLTAKGDKVLVNVEQVGEDRVQFSDKNKTPYTANADQGNVFEFLPVEQGLYDIANDMIYVSRRPARQWKRGVCVDNTNLFSFLGGDFVGVNHQRLEAVFNPKPANHFANMLVQWIKGDRLGLALSQQFGIWNGKLYIYNRVIGEVSKDTIKVQSVFLQEIKDLIRDRELKFKLEEVKDA